MSSPAGDALEWCHGVTVQMFQAVGSCRVLSSGRLASLRLWQQATWVIDDTPHYGTILESGVASQKLWANGPVMGKSAVSGLISECLGVRNEVLC